MKKMVTMVFVIASLLVFFTGLSLAVPPDQPPVGKVWVEVGGAWILVGAPPGDGPYVWRENKWIIDPTPPPTNAEWIPGHWIPGHKKGDVWIPGHWVSGHWENVAAPGPGAHWVSGHWKGNQWMPGHWAGSPPQGKHWVPGHRGPGGRWMPGHWR